MVRTARSAIKISSCGAGSASRITPEALMVSLPTKEGLPIAPDSSSLLVEAGSLRALPLAEHPPFGKDEPLASSRFGLPLARMNFQEEGR